MSDVKKKVMIPVRTPSRIESVEVSGTPTGPFVVHTQRQLKRAGGAGHWARPGWSVTHIATGYTACPNIPNRQSALHAATLFQKLPVSWDFTDPATCKEWTDDVRMQVNVIRAAAQAGGEA